LVVLLENFKDLYHQRLFN